jgi:DNA-binding winged helix-turn-helix (wHTH) protein
MGAPALAKRLYRFGLFSADAESGKLLREGLRVKLQDQPFRVLCLLLEHAGQVVTREELRQSLWSSDTYVEFDGSLNAALKRLRYALGDSPDNPIFIETLPKRGYRFVAPVTVEESVGNAWVTQDKGDETYAAKGDSPEDTAPVPSTQPERAHWRQRLLFGFALALLVAAGVASYHRLTSADETKRVRVSQPPSVRPRVFPSL